MLGYKIFSLVKSFSPLLFFQFIILTYFPSEKKLRRQYRSLLNDIIGLRAKRPLHKQKSTTLPLGILPVPSALCKLLYSTPKVASEYAPQGAKRTQTQSFDPAQTEILAIKSTFKIQLMGFYVPVLFQ